MILRFLLGSLTPANLPEQVTGVHSDDLGVQLADEHVHDHIALALAQEAMVHEHAGELIAYGAMDQCSGYR